jgi:hypothetical protein
MGDTSYRRGDFSINRFLSDALDGSMDVLDTEGQREEFGGPKEMVEDDDVNDDRDYLNSLHDSETELYHDLLRKNPAYSWLLASLQSAATLSHEDDDVMKRIRTDILSALPSEHKISRRSASRPYQLTLEVDWDPILFVEEQQYSERLPEAIRHSITLTGSGSDAQALTVESYLLQVWPATGMSIIDLITNLLTSEDHRATCK